MSKPTLLNPLGKTNVFQPQSFGEILKSKSLTKAKGVYNRVFQKIKKAVARKHLPLASDRQISTAINDAADYNLVSEDDAVRVSLIMLKRNR